MGGGRRRVRRIEGWVGRRDGERWRWEEEDEELGGLKDGWEGGMGRGGDGRKKTKS